MEIVKLLTFLFLALGVFKIIDILVKKTKNEKNKNTKLLLYLAQVVLGVAGLFLFYGAFTVARTWVN